MLSPEPPVHLGHRVITFYSYKGGVGRSMALANVAVLLAELGRRVLVVDFDLEAPGLHRYFDQDRAMVEVRSSKQGLVELIDAYREKRPLDWRRCLSKLRWSKSAHGIDLIPAGGSSSNYAELVQNLNWEDLFRHHGFGDYLSRLRDEWRSSYDIVLIDSRTGMSDIGGICTILLPDALVMLFTANGQSIDGTAEVVRRARAAQETLPVERGRLVAIPVLSRDDRRTEYEQSERWRARIADTMAPFFEDWVSKDVTAVAVLQKLYLPQVAYWSFGERLPVLERPEECDDPASLGGAYARLARLLNADLNWEALQAEAGPDIVSLKLKFEQRLAHLRRMAFLLILAIAGLAILVTSYLYIQSRPQAQAEKDGIENVSDPNSPDVDPETSERLRSLAERARKLVGGMPSCTPGDAPIFDIIFMSDGDLSPRPIYSTDTGIWLRSVPGAGSLVYGPHSPDRFVDFAAAMRDWGRRQPVPCAFRVRVGPAYTANMAIYDHQLALVQQYFYTSYR